MSTSQPSSRITEAIPQAKNWEKTRDTTDKPSEFIHAIVMIKHGQLKAAYLELGLNHQTLRNYITGINLPQGAYLKQFEKFYPNDFPRLKELIDKERGLKVE